MKYLLLLMICSLSFAACEKEYGDDEEDDMNASDAKLADVSEATFSKSTIITNIYFPLPAGKKYIYEGTTEEGLERVEEMRLSETKTIMGVVCVVDNFKAFVDGNLVEEAFDWYAQADDGTVWYFGEHVDNYDENGNLADHEGSWEAGVDGALPGIIMPADPRRGLKYREEFYPGVAEDEAQVIQTGREITIGLGTFTNCIVTRNWTKLEPGIVERKVYAPNTGLIRETNKRERSMLDLIAIE